MYQGPANHSDQYPDHLRGQIACLPCVGTETASPPLSNSAAVLGNRLPDASTTMVLSASTFARSAALPRASRGIFHVPTRRSYLAWTSTRQKKDMTLAKCVSSSQIWAAKKPKRAVHAILDVDDAPIFEPDEVARKLCQHWEFQRAGCRRPE